MPEHSPIKVLEMYVGNLKSRDGDKFIENSINLVSTCKPTEVYSLAVRYREEKRNLFIPFFLAYCMMKVPGHKNIVDVLIVDLSKTVEDLMMVVNIYRGIEGSGPIASCIKRGIGFALPNINVEKAKDKSNARWLLKMFHPKPVDNKQSETWRNLLEATHAD